MFTLVFTNSKNAKRWAESDHKEYFEILTQYKKLIQGKNATIYIIRMREVCNSNIWTEIEKEYGGVIL